MAELATKETTAQVAVPEHTRGGNTYVPRVDIVDLDKELVLYADLPGVRPEDLDVRYENGELTIHGKVCPRHEQANYLYSEYDVGDYYRVFRLSDEIDSDKITAELKHGVLRLHLPKVKAAQPRRIAVRAG